LNLKGKIIIMFSKVLNEHVILCGNDFDYSRLELMDSKDSLGNPIPDKCPVIYYERELHYLNAAKLDDDGLRLVHNVKKIFGLRTVVYE